MPDADKAIACYRRALTLEPRGFQIMGRLADLHILRAESLILASRDPGPDLAEALRYSQESRRLNPRSYLGPCNAAEALLLRARWRTRQGQDAKDDLAEAESALAQGLALRVGDPELLIDRALLDRERLRRAVRLGQPWSEPLASGRAHVGEVLARNPTHALALRTLGELCLLAAQAEHAPAAAGRLRNQAEAAFARARAANGLLARELDRLRRDP